MILLGASNYNKNVTCILYSNRVFLVFRELEILKNVPVVWKFLELFKILLQS